MKNQLLGKEGVYTGFELKQIVSLKSTYTKNCYLLLKQFKNTGWWKVPID